MTWDSYLFGSCCKTVFWVIPAVFNPEAMRGQRLWNQWAPGISEIMILI